MKIEKYLMRAIVFLVALFFCGNINVKADSYDGKILPSEYIKGVYIMKEKAGTTQKSYLTAQIIRRSTDNHFVYCVEPFMSVDSSKNYNITAQDYLEILNLSREQWQKMSLYAYYGYGYGNHTQDKWWAVTQLLIWRTVDSNSKFYFTNTLNGTKDDSKFANEIAELESLVNNHKIQPSFNIKSRLNIGESITITDNNKVLNNYSIVHSGNISVSRGENQLTITANEVGDASITLEKKSNLYDTDPMLYYATSSQNVMSVGNYDPIRMKLNLNVTGGKIRIHKFDSGYGEINPQSDIVLEGAIYGLYDKNNNLLQKMITGSDGVAESDILALGKYKIKELEAPKGYNIDSVIYDIEITEDNLYPDLNFYDEIINRDIQIHKYYANKSTGILIPESDVIFQFFDEDDLLIEQVITDEDGIATFNLPYGTYKGKQLTTTSGYEKVQNFTITINENSPEIIHLSFTNHPISAKIKLVKKDYNSKKPILFPGATFKIKDTDTGLYVCQNVTYPKKEKICEYITNEYGELITPEALVTGNYQIEEVLAPKGYKLNKEVLSFRIDDESNIINDSIYGNYLELEFFDSIIKGEIIVEKTGEILKVFEDGFKFDKVSLSNVEFSLYADEDIKTLDGVIHYKKGDLVTTLNTNVKGIAKFNDLYLGKYIVKETKTLNNYVLDEKEHKVELVDNNSVSIVSEKIELTNEIKKGNLLFTKTDLVTGEVIPNTFVEIYTDADELIYTGLTDENGMVVINELPVGTYYIIEKEPATGYVITEEKVFFEIKENGEIVKAEMSNKPIIGILEFTKVDFSTSEPLPNTLIEIYKEDNTLIYSGYTDQEGKIIIDELRYGRYYILEKEAPEGYEINSEKMYFEILHDGEIVKATIKDEKVKVDVPDTFAEDSYFIEIISGVLILMGIGGLLYVSKRKAR